jgi:hypothetical protein
VVGLLVLTRRLNTEPKEIDSSLGIGQDANKIANMCKLIE